MFRFFLNVTEYVSPLASKFVIDVNYCITAFPETIKLLDRIFLLMCLLFYSEAVKNLVFGNYIHIFISIFIFFIEVQQFKIFHYW